MKKTPVAAAELGVQEWQLRWLLRARKISPPARDTSNHLLWSNKDIKTARKALQLDRRARHQAVAS
jgi:hypothetical protein